MQAKAVDIKLPLLWGSSILLFFFNSFLLPEGLTMSLLLTPAWIYMLWKMGAMQSFAGILLPFMLFAMVHVANGVHPKYYAISFTLLAATISFVMVTAKVVAQENVNWDLIFKDIVLLNFALALLAIPCLFIPALKEQVWYFNSISKNIEYLPRLKLFASEASHYSLLLAPLLIYFTARMLFFPTKNGLPTLLMLLIPLLMSFSLGVISAVAISGIIVIAWNARRIFFSRKRIFFFFGTIVLGGVALYILYKLDPGNPLFARMQNIYTGEDTSSRGRTYEAFIIAHKVAEEKSLWFGIGPGQLKVLARDIIAQYYNYMSMPEVVRIPNATAETLACFGYTGLALRLIFEFVLFVRTNVSANPFRLWLFLFIFIYQFTGSYITNVSEYLIWIFVFSPIFPDFSEEPRKQMAHHKVQTGTVV